MVVVALTEAAWARVEEVVDIRVVVEGVVF